MGLDVVAGFFLYVMLERLKSEKMDDTEDEPTLETSLISDNK